MLQEESPGDVAIPPTVPRPLVGPSVLSHPSRATEPLFSAFAGSTRGGGVAMSSPNGHVRHLLGLLGMVCVWRVVASLGEALDPAFHGAGTDEDAYTLERSERVIASGGGHGARHHILWRAGRLCPPRKRRRAV